MLSSSLSVLVFETKVGGSASRVSAIRRGLGFTEGRGAHKPHAQLAKRLSYCLTPKSMLPGGTPG